MMDIALYCLLAAIFLLAGIVKGVTGMGLPTVAVALLSLLMPLPAAAALLIIPSLVTNLLQLFSGPALKSLCARLWPMMLCIVAGTLASSGLMRGGGTRWAAAGLGAVLAAYALFALFSPNLQISRRIEKWLSPVAGLCTGLITGATGVFVLPAVPWLQSLSLDRHQLVQALGLSFTLSTVALAGGLYLHGVWLPGQLALSTLAVLPAVVGMAIGGRIRSRISATLFRRCFLGLLLILGLEMSLNPLLG